MKRFKGGGRKTSFKPIEDVCLAYVKECNDKHIRVIPRMLKSYARQVAARLNITNFTASSGWLHRFKLG